MNVGDLFQRLSFGDLLNLSLGQDGSGTIAAHQEDRVVSYANSALTGLYSRFLHKRNFVDVVLQADVTRYQLRSIYAVSTTTANPTKPHYIKDTVLEPYTDDIIRIIGHENHEIEQADIDLVAASVRILSNDTFLVTEPKAGAVLTIEYQANHPRLSIPAQVLDVISLAPLLEEALEARVAASVYSAMDGEAQLLKARTLLDRYEQICQIVKIEDLLPESSSTEHARLPKGGWV